jgi:molecular chaperone DnaK
MSSPIIGIDLGTTNSVVAVVREGRSEIIPMADGASFLPSAVRFFDNGMHVVGDAARRSATVDPRYTVTSIKRFMGRMFNEVMDLAELARFEVVPLADGRAAVQLHDRAWLPEEISALILAQLRSAAERHLGEEITRAVMTIPAYFTAAQGQATRRAAELANLKVERFITEPTAAALSNAAGRSITALVLDLGGGTYDVSLLESGDGVVEVKATDGDGYLGGDDFDEALFSWASGEILRRHGRRVQESPEAVQRLRDAVIDVKCVLSTRTSAEVSLPFLFHDSDVATDVLLPVSRVIFESLCEQLFERLIPPVKRVVAGAGVSLNRLDAIYAVGAATRMPGVASIVHKWTGIRPSYRVDPEHAVALGAAIEGGILGGHLKETLLLDTTPYPISIESAEGEAIVLIDVNTTIPTRKSEVFTTAHNEQTTIEVTVLQGSAPEADANRLLTRFAMSNIPRAPRGVPRIEVTVDVDANGMLLVGAKDLGTGHTVQSEFIHLR